MHKNFWTGDVEFAPGYRAEFGVTLLFSPDLKPRSVEVEVSYLDRFNSRIISLCPINLPKYEDSEWVDDLIAQAIRIMLRQMKDHADGIHVDLALQCKRHACEALDAVRASKEGTKP